MWPWEHLAVGYLAYSALSRYRHGESPTTAATVAVALGTQFPDLVDKPLGWGFALFQGGISVAHSVFTAAILSVVVVAVGRRLERPQLGVAFVVGYLSHIPADAVYGAVFDGTVKLTPFLWPLVETGSSASSGILDNVTYYVIRFLVFLTTERGLAFLSLEALLLSFTAWIWIRDGCPGLPSRTTVAALW